MRIIHYFLGFPPYRTGGLTKYAMDLMKSQVLDGHVVMALWPGEIKLVNKKTHVSQRASVDEIINYELINPLPVPLDEGIKEFDEYMKPCSEDIYVKFLTDSKPDVIHIHTLMGLHKEFIDAAEKLCIKTVFTTHDYFGICPKVTLYRCGNACEDDLGCKGCVQCNKTALSLKTVFVMQSPFYRTMKNSNIVKILRKRHRSDFFAEERTPEINVENVDRISEQYRRLRAYYISILIKIGTIHFNSSVSEKVYKRYFIPKNSKLISITHKDIVDNIKVNLWQPDEKLRITCLAPAKPFKGFSVLKNALDELWNSGNHGFKLNIFSAVNAPSEYMYVKEDGYAYSELGKIMSVTDVLVAPSIWYETFGFTVLEALSYGVPVIVSDHVGAKEIIGNGGIVVEAGSIDQLKQAICSLNKEQLINLRREIKENADIKLWPQLLKETYQLYEA